ncbi:TetR/AcrR family transcriptional regulator [Pseudonocardia sp. MH-G8]|uniref:TetR/AcrR family transcriptional regulator n=1 Tax=Pseudonocardia sp. MH-G8 TaxID=1854588 RepID=UPI000BA12B09|nr:TetR/AcrR family transcriptional regulator [Pseudonocardia sp. MH-G8]OZM76413.1 TetR family transcriptional regulator [Pseudonocardia sp. MH-G8]
MAEARPLLDDAVLAAAARVIAEHGWHDFTLERVAQAAGVSRVTLYRRGTTREQLVDALVVGAAQAWQAALWPALADPGTATERLEAALRACCTVVEEHLALLAGLSTAPDPVFHLDEPSAGGGRDTREVFVAPFERLVRDGIAEGGLRAGLDPAETAVLLFNVVPRTYLHLRSAHGWPAGRTADSLLDLLLAGLRDTTGAPADHHPHGATERNQ